jgi:hypothetical protein
VARTAVFFFMGNHSGLAIMAQTAKKPCVETTFQCSGESRVKVKSAVVCNIEKRKRGSVRLQILT